jgi:N-acetylneuraminic acid mutarotase
MQLSKTTILLVCLIAPSWLWGQNWVQKSSLPDTAFGRHHPVTFSIGGYGYLLGGSSTEVAYLSDFYRYDPATDQWTQLPDFPGPERSYSYAVVHEGKAYMGFGFGPIADMSDLWMYDPVTGVWTEKALCPGDGRGHPAFLEAGGKIYVGLGGSATGNRNDFWEYDIAGDKWEQMPDFPSYKRHHPFHFSIDSMVYVAFGHGSINVNGSTIYNDLYRFDPQTKTWEQMNDFPGEARVAGTQFSYNGKGYVLSGEGEDHYYLDEGEFWEYDPGTDSWKQLPPVPGSGRWAPGSFVIGDTVYFTCGTALVENSNSENQTDLWAYAFETISSATDLAGSEQTLTVFPNPVTDKLFIQGDWNNNTQFQILHPNGQVLRSGIYDQNSGIELLSLPAGVFGLSLLSENTQYQAKFVKF